MQESILGVFRGSVIIGQMIADINITEKSFGAKQLMSGVAFGVDDGEKIGVIGRNGIGKSTLFDILAGTDTDYTGSVIYHRGVTVVATAQEHHGIGDVTVMEYILAGLPEYSHLHQIITTYPETMADNMRKINEYSQALDRFGQKGYYQIEEMVAEHYPALARLERATVVGGVRQEYVETFGPEPTPVNLKTWLREQVNATLLRHHLN